MNGAVNYGRIFRGRGIARVGREDAPAVGAAPGGVAEAVTSATQGGTRVQAILYLPKRVPGGGKVPGFAVVNGHGGNTGSGYAYHTGLARGGLQDGFSRICADAWRRCAGRWTGCSSLVLPKRAGTSRIG